MKGYPTIYNNIIFIEASMPEGQDAIYIYADLSFKFGAQLKSLTDVKKELSHKAIELGRNCVSEFKYGQKSRWLAIDDVAHFGNGIAVKLSEARYNEIVDYIQNKNQ